MIDTYIRFVSHFYWSDFESDLELDLDPGLRLSEMVDLDLDPEKESFRFSNYAQKKNTYATANYKLPSCGGYSYRRRRDVVAVISTLPTTLFSLNSYFAFLILILNIQDTYLFAFGIDSVNIFFYIFNLTE